MGACLACVLRGVPESMRPGRALRAEIYVSTWETRMHNDAQSVYLCSNPPDDVNVIVRRGEFTLLIILKRLMRALIDHQPNHCKRPISCDEEQASGERSPGR